MSYLKYWDGNNLYGLSMSQKHPVNKFEWVKNTFKFNKDFKKCYNGKCGEKYFSKLMFKIMKNYMNFKMTCNFYKKLKKQKSLLPIYVIKLNILLTSEI